MAMMTTLLRCWWRHRRRPAACCLARILIAACVVHVVICATPGGSHHRGRLTSTTSVVSSSASASSAAVQRTLEKRTGASNRNGGGGVLRTAGFAGVGGGGGVVTGGGVLLGGPSLTASTTLHDAGANEHVTKGKICIGTNGRMSVPNNRDHHYRNLKDRFTNCTYVDGNLELTWLQDDNLDLSFLHYIREVTGYVLISHVDIRRIVLPRLQIIRGRTLFKINVSNEEFALIVTLSKMYSIEMPALRDVLSGSVGLLNNYNLCHIKTINWKEIITDPKGIAVFAYNFTSPQRECSKCDNRCEQGCWGEGPDNCQKFSKENCSPQCYQGRCFGSNPRECCHLFCAGGCTGPKQSDCIACRNFYDDGVCTQECPPMQIYNPSTYSWEPNPKGKYAYGATCVKNCPEHLLKDSGACVRTCPMYKKAVRGECVPCDGPCPKTCQGDVLINSNNIDSFADCTVIEGHIHILENSLKGYQTIYPNYTFGDRNLPMHPDRLEVFSTLKEITGFLDIQASHPDFKNLSYFRNLETIGGRSLYDYFSSIYIVKTSLESLDLRSLKYVSAGTVVILENRNLCFAENINWTKLRRVTTADSMLSTNKNHSDCVRDNKVCDPQCSIDGCWGAGPDQCLTCKHYNLGTMCLQNCSILPGIYRAENRECKPCHEQCGSACHGPGPDNCTTCKHFKDGPFCVSECPSTKYTVNGECKPCHDHCLGGCTGPLAVYGAGGCTSCEKALMNGSSTVCLHRNEPCPDGYFYENVHSQEDELKPLAGKIMCRKCHPRCKKCTGFGFHETVCQQCTNYKRGEQCEDECPQDHFADDDTQECKPCDRECRGCFGLGNSSCLGCQNLKVYEGGEPSNTSAFVCTSQCPDEYPHRVFAQQDLSESYCSAQPGHALLVGQGSKVFLVAGCTVLVVFFVIVAYIGYYFKRRVRDKENALKMALTGLEDEPLRPTNIKPNLAQIRMIKEAEIRKGGILGHGAFGIVYKGVWVPEGESNKIPVAIKVLHEDTGANTSKEFLDEAYIMASMDHPNLLQLLAVCMTSQMMLVTQLMPLGCLLDYVRNNKDRIGAKALLTWCTQIARGMAYLEEKRLVHRDLAARNVLVQTPACVKITDFGLAKLLDINEDEYKAAGGKMPIKWLALECIQHRIFTHKSDVWAFGVTVWELLTFGGRPYDNVPARKLPELLELGEKLPQPTICSTEVYLIMIKCWIMDAECRPGFKELAEDFAKMSGDPGRYLAIGGLGVRRFGTHDERSLRSGTQNHRHAHHHSLDTSSLPSSQQQHHHHQHHHSGTSSDINAYMQQPKSRAPLPTSLSVSPTPLKLWPHSLPASNHSYQPTTTTTSSSSDGGGAEQPQNQQNWSRERERMRNTFMQHQHRPYSASETSGGTAPGMRYLDGTSADNTYGGGGSDEYDSGSRTHAQVGSLKLELPVDEDDYLMPSPQQQQQQHQGGAHHASINPYMDLIADRFDVIGSTTGSGGGDYHRTTEFTNPEYLVSEDAEVDSSGVNSVPTLTLGIPSASTEDLPAAVAAVAAAAAASGAVVIRNGVAKRSCSVDEESSSDHEYYNDFDRLQRELQPLQHSSLVTAAGNGVAPVATTTTAAAMTSASLATTTTAGVVGTGVGGTVGGAVTIDGGETTV